MSVTAEASGALSPAMKTGLVVLVLAALFFIVWPLVIGAKDVAKGLADTGANVAKTAANVTGLATNGTSGLPDLGRVIGALEFPTTGAQPQPHPNTAAGGHAAEGGTYANPAYKSLQTQLRLQFTKKWEFPLWGVLGIGRLHVYVMVLNNDTGATVASTIHVHADNAAIAAALGGANRDYTYQPTGGVCDIEIQGPASFAVIGALGLSMYATAVGYADSNAIDVH